MVRIDDLGLFTRSAALGSFTAAALEADLLPGQVAAAIKRLERELDVRLFARTTRSLRLTAEGEQYLPTAHSVLEALKQGKENLRGENTPLRGVLQVAAPSDLGRNVLLPWLHAFQEQHPEVDIRLQLSDRVANVYSDPVDAAFRYGKPPDSGLVALPLAPGVRRVLCASPAYIARHGVPTTPHELTGHGCLCFMLGDEVHDRWRFTPPGDGAEVTVRVRSVNVSNDGDAVRRWALLGKGIAYKAGLDVAADLAAGRLQALCPNWTTEPTPLFLVVPSRRQLTPLVRTLRDFVAHKIAALGGAGSPTSAQPVGN